MSSLSSYNSNNDNSSKFFISNNLILLVVLPNKIIIIPVLKKPFSINTDNRIHLCFLNYMKKPILITAHSQQSPELNTNMVMCLMSNTKNFPTATKKRRAYLHIYNLQNARADSVYTENSHTLT